MTVAYLAARGYEQQLVEELARGGVAITRRHGRLILTTHPPIASRWAANVWFDAETIAIRSISHASQELRRRQRNWWSYAPSGQPAGRTKLIAAELPHVSARPLALGEAAPSAPLGSWTLLDASTMLCAPRCSSAFPNGEVRFVEDHDGPPNRAYLKLWEAFVRLGRWPGPADKCVDLGASPGGWTWTLARLGARVVAVDRAPLDPRVASLPTVEARCESAFGLDPDSFVEVDWLCCDVAAYPERIAALSQRWLGNGRVANAVVTIKLHGPSTTLPAALDRLADAEIVHLHHNRHELTLLWPAARRPSCD